MIDSQSQKIRKIIYDTIYTESNTETKDFDSNQELKFYGIYAESLIYSCAKAIQLPDNYIEDFFPYDLYFFQETPFTGMILTVRWLKTLLNKYCNLNLNIPQKQPITASQFADIMIDIFEKYQAEHKQNQ